MGYYSCASCLDYDCMGQGENNTIGCPWHSRNLSKNEFKELMKNNVELGYIKDQQKDIETMKQVINGLKEVSSILFETNQKRINTLKENQKRIKRIQKRY